MKENRADARCLMASGFMLFGALACFIAGLVIFAPAFEKLAPVGALPFLMGGICYLWFAFRLWRGDRRPVASLNEFIKGNIFFALSIFLFFHSYGRYVGYFGDEPALFKGVMYMMLSICGSVFSLGILRGEKSE